MDDSSSFDSVSFYALVGISIFVVIAAIAFCVYLKRIPNRQVVTDIPHSTQADVPWNKEDGIPLNKV